MESPKQNDFIRELQRLHDAHIAALRAKDADAIDAAQADLALFLRYHTAGRLAEWFATHGAREDA